MRRSRLINLATLAACVGAAALWPSGAQAVSLNTEIAFQANTGSLWTWTVNGAHDMRLGMMAGTSPSVAPLSGFASDHEIAFQANTSSLWTTGAFGQGDMRLGMMPGTSPSIAGINRIAFTANTGRLWVTGDGEVGYPVAYRSSPSMALAGATAVVAFTDPGVGGAGYEHGDVVVYTSDEFDTTRHAMAGTSPSINARQDYAFQESSGELYVSSSPSLSGAHMKAGTSPSINDKGDVAFQASTGHLWVNGTDTNVSMMAGTSPSIDHAGDVAFQGFDSSLGLLPAGSSRALRLGLGMMAGTSPSIGLDPGN